MKKGRKNTPASKLHERLRALVGGLPSGSRIPPLRELAVRLQVSHVLVAKLMHQLEVEGLVIQGSQRIRYTTTPAVEATNKHALPAGTVVVVSEVTQIDPANPFLYHTQTLLALSRVLHEAKMQTLLIRPPTSQEDLDRLQALDADGWIVTEHAVIAMPHLLPLLAKLARDGRAVAIAADTLTAAQIDDFPGATVCTDHRGGAAALVGVLAERGRRRLAVAWTDRAHPNLGMHWMCERAAGIAEGCARHGLEQARSLTLPTLPHCPDPHLGFDRQTDAWAGGLFRSVLRDAEPIDGLLAVSDGSTYPLLAASRLLGRVPGVDLDVTGYDNYWRGVPERAWAGAVPCATIDKDGIAVGTQLAKVMIDPIRRRDRIVVPSRLVIPLPDVATSTT